MTARVGEDVTIGASFDRPDRVKKALLLFEGERGERGVVEFQRSSDPDHPYLAVIPATAVHGRQVGYAIELETTQGRRVPVFASREAPHEITVLDTPADAREAALFTRLEGRRSVVSSAAEYVGFGSTTTELDTPSGPVDRRVSDRYYRIEGNYTYRLLGPITEFGIRAGVVRGEAPVAGETDPSKYQVGLNYGAPRVRLRATDWLHVEGELLTSVTEVGFSVGGGGAVLVGDAYGSKMVLGFETVQVFGTRGYTRLDVVASKRLTLSPSIEVTNMPHADRAGVRLLGDVALDLGRGFAVVARGGYQARSFQQGGPTLGGALAYAF
jgi:hypothetical protein